MTHPSETKAAWRPDLFVMVDATGSEWEDQGMLFAGRVGVLTEISDVHRGPVVGKEGSGIFDPACLRWHVLSAETPIETVDRRMSIATVNDYDGVYADVKDGQAPFGQVEWFDAENRSTRERDLAGRVAIPPSFRRVTDSEDGRYAIAQTLRELEISEAEGTEDDGKLPEGVQIVTEATGPATNQGPRVTITGTGGAVNFFGSAAVAAAQRAAALGGSIADIAAAASAGARGVAPPEITRERDPDDGLPPGPDADADGPAIQPADKPAGYVHNGARIGLTGSFFSPALALGAWFAGKEGTPIGPLVARHDGQFGMPNDSGGATPPDGDADDADDADDGGGGGHVGRILFDSRDAALLTEGEGKFVKGWMFRDSSRANMDTELGFESCQWRPVIRVDSKLPPGGDPPPKKGTWMDLRDPDDPLSP